MTPSQLSRLHNRAFNTDRGWSTQEFEDLLLQDATRLYDAPDGFLLVRTILDESEILTLAVDPSKRRCGIADQLLSDFLKMTTAQTVFLEVAADNAPALSLYHKHGFARAGVRSAYYARKDGTKVDAVLMTRAMTRRQSTE